MMEKNFKGKGLIYTDRGLHVTVGQVEYSVKDGKINDRGGLPYIFTVKEALKRGPYYRECFEANGIKSEDISDLVAFGQDTFIFVPVEVAKEAVSQVEAIQKEEAEKKAADTALRSAYDPKVEIEGYKELSEAMNKLEAYQEAFDAAIDSEDGLSLNRPANPGITDNDIRELAKKYPKATAYRQVEYWLLDLGKERFAKDAQLCFINGGDWEKAMKDMEERYGKYISSKYDD
jgi:hypothetical protein